MDFVVLRVNGKDVSAASHEDAIEAFLQAEEPITVEVLRRNSTAPRPPPSVESPCCSDSSPKSTIGSSPLSNHSTNSNLCDTATQTEWTPGWDMSALFETGFVLPPPVESSGTPEELDDDDTYEVEYEEVVLRRSNSSDKLGLTLCYGDPDQQETEIYVGEVDPNSVAAKDGRLQEGDQILQVNGVDLIGRDQAISMFSEKRYDFTLLVARPKHDFVARSESLEYTTPSPTTPYSSLQYTSILEEVEEEEGIPLEKTNANAEKDSGVGRTDDSTKNEESSEEDVMIQALMNGDETTTDASPTSPPPESSIVERADQQMSVLATEFRRITLDKKASVEQWVKHTACLRKWDGTDNKSNKNDNHRHQHQGKQNNRRHSPPTLELARCGSVMSLTKSDHSSSQGFNPDYRINNCDSCRHKRGPNPVFHAPPPPASTPPPLTSMRRGMPKTVSEPSNVQRGIDNNQEYVSNVYPSPTMYTNQANLQHTIWIQQQLLKQALVRHQKENEISRRNSKRESKRVIMVDPEDAKMEWRVKCRADGTRYITRRPARTKKVMKDREARLLEERSGLTTDDDAFSELKIGKYWSKEDRKKHLERAKDRKKKELIHKEKMAILTEEDLNSKSRSRSTSKHRHVSKESDHLHQQPSPQNTSTMSSTMASLGILAVTTV